MEEEHLSPLKATKKAHEIAGAIIAITFLMAAVLFQLLYVWSSGVFIDNNYGNCNHSFRDRGIDIDTCTLCYNVKKQSW
jgi:hypothetical protein